MESLKKNPIFAAIAIVCVLVFLTGVVLTVLANGAVGKAAKKFDRAERELNAAHRGEVAPSPDNVAASAQNLTQLTNELKRIRADLEKGANLQLSEDGVSVMASIQQFISESSNKLDSHQSVEAGSGDSVDSPITYEEGFAFGFDAYSDASTIPEDSQIISLLDKQRIILEAIVDKLVASNPESIELIERESLEGPVSNRRKGKVSGTFIIDPEVSARVPNAIKTTAFRVGFKGYSSTLRSFLNQLAEFDLPIVVRSVEVERPEGSDTVDLDQAEPENSLESIFGNFGSTDDTEEAPKQEAQKPVIVDNISTFILVLEFIEVVLPTENTAAGADAA